MNLSAARVFVRNIAEAKQFYAECLGLPLKADGSQYGYCVFSAGQTDLVVELVGPDAPQDDQFLVGRFTGLSFAVGDIDAKHQQLASAGVQFSGLPEKQRWEVGLPHSRTWAEMNFSLFNIRPNPAFNTDPTRRASPPPCGRLT